MCRIRDEDAPLIAMKVHTKLLEGGKPDSRRAAGSSLGGAAAAREGEKEGVYVLGALHTSRNVIFPLN